MSDIDDLLRESVRPLAEPTPLAPWHEIERRARIVRRPRWARRGLVVAVLALALAGALLVGNPTGGSSPSPLERASAAVSDWPPNQILHVRVRMISHFDQPDQLEESWQLTSPPYTKHVVTEFPAGATGADRLDWSASGTGFGQAYDFRTNQVIQTAEVPADWRPGGIEQSTRADIQRWLAYTHATNLGESEVDGHRVLGFEAFGHARLYVDAETYLPILDRSFGMGSGDELLGYDHHYTWELLPATPENRALLDVAPAHADATIAPVTGDVWRSAQFALGGLMRPLTVPGG